MRRDGGGSHRLAGPGREQLILLNRLVVLNASSDTQQPLSKGAGWTPARPTAGDI